METVFDCLFQTTRHSHTPTDGPTDGRGRTDGLPNENDGDDDEDVWSETRDGGRVDGTTNDDGSTHREKNAIDDDASTSGWRTIGGERRRGCGRGLVGRVHGCG